MSLLSKAGVSPRLIILYDNYLISTDDVHTCNDVATS